MLDLVDAAFKRPGGPAGEQMARVCASCPIWRECLTEALENGEHGPWGGTTRKVRSRVAPRPVTFNLRDVHTDAPVGAAATVQRLDHLGVTSADVKSWAGLTFRGVPSLAVIDAYAQAHHLTAA